ncbi:hypothetical protein Huta_0635 [Halorhabdus utahensis DSM 12940]|uniref:Intracellular proteinase inhibitor BsuPI domain-containing protein n=1 Tax=Halorhabdus utahensis (strain DSM 12940 / JCM 11049 / AX-2) TaxID=519442 RepID=C7NTA0_HALUD|nr:MULTISPECIES: hypothetical protein [Halorhabdus]ACV10822.1 hypothetical protein Huta_0635 [Halorhabdus utahensis DSM 12940]WEL18122.1 putative membrane protein [Halorhabdus sp. SVX81]
MKRRELLGAGALALLGGGAAATAAGFGPLATNDTDEPVYFDSAFDPITYERESLRLQAPTDAVPRGESITFELHHTGESEDISLGCHVPWAIQRYEDGTWEHVVWTDGRWTLLCGTTISPGETQTITVPLSATALAGEEHGVTEEEADGVAFTPGKYRFFVLANNPPLAVNFRVLPRE